MKINISIDDISPMPENCLIFEQCEKLIQFYPNIKITLFLIMAQKKMNEDQIYYFDKNILFLNKIKNLSPINYEFAWHGWHHSYKDMSNNDEFKYLNTNDTKDIFNKMKDMADSSGILSRMESIFRPPAFWINKESACALNQSGITHFALSQLEHHIKYYYENGQNWNFGETNYFDIMPPIIKCKRKELMSVVFHAGIYSKNFLNADKLIKFINENNCEFLYYKDYCGQFR